MNFIQAQDKCAFCNEYKRKSTEEYEYDAYLKYRKECLDTKVIYYRDTVVVESKKHATAYVEYKKDFCGKFSQILKYNIKNKSLIDGYTIDEGDTIFSVMDNPETSSSRMSFIIKFIAENLKYPKEALDKKLEGKVFVQFTLNEFGDPIKVFAIKAPDKLLAIEAVNLIKSIRNLPPVKYKNRFVKMNFIIPINFKID